MNEERDAFDGVDRMRRIVDDATPGKHRERRATRDVRGLRDSAAYVPASGAGAWTVERALKTLASDRVAEHADASEALAEMFAASPATGVEIVMKGGIRAITGAIAAGNAAFAAGGLALLHMFRVCGDDVASRQGGRRRRRRGDARRRARGDATVLEKLRGATVGRDDAVGAREG